ncbi:zinc ribbon domain-containing protein [Schleiferilactobacillus perolens]|jgi:hypothetical protein|uniref:zinc ribbon domain-containing protein n=1 Tax=Schleiferilactobacillus perolens TaxID=100468 RepID=UPI00070E321D|nr:zinc ribbon domain-containing protein [Schleiferilactobacillus perolens]MCI2172160.1 zinc ribbon domain-containing protein [Schleiferilactobacillus perolens]
MIKICPNCGHHNTVDAKFCVKCGFNLTDVAAIDPNAAAAPASAASTAAPSETSVGATGNSAAPSSATSQPVQPTPSAAANQPVQPAAQQAYQQPQPTQTAPAQPNPTLDMAKQYSSNYFSTLLLSWQHPSDAERITGSERKYFGYVTLALVVLLSTLNIWAAIQKTGDLVNSLLAQYSSDITPVFRYLFGGDLNAQTISNYIATKTSGIYLQFFVYALIMIAIFAVVGFVTRRFLIGDAIGFTDYTNRFAFRASATIPTLLLTLIIIWFGGGSFSLLLITLLLTIYQVQLNVALFVTSNEARQNGKMDRVFSLVIMQVVANAAASYLMLSWFSGVISRFTTDLR